MSKKKQERIFVTEDEVEGIKKLRMQEQMLRRALGDVGEEMMTWWETIGKKYGFTISKTPEYSLNYKTREITKIGDGEKKK